MSAISRPRTRGVRLGRPLFPTRQAIDDSRPGTGPRRDGAQGVKNISRYRRPWAAPVDEANWFRDAFPVGWLDERLLDHPEDGEERNRARLYR